MDVHSSLISDLIGGVCSPLRDAVLFMLCAFCLSTDMSSLLIGFSVSVMFWVVVNG